eukprot:COSAG05_NODE_4266_length_1590_cov_417.551308_2_plen_168_part_00
MLDAPAISTGHLSGIYSESCGCRLYVVPRALPCALPAYSTVEVELRCTGLKEEGTNWQRHAQVTVTTTDSRAAPLQVVLSPLPTSILGPPDISTGHRSEIYSRFKIVRLCTGGGAAGHAAAAAYAAAARPHGGNRRQPQRARAAGKKTDNNDWHSSYILGARVLRGW